MSYIQNMNCSHCRTPIPKYIDTVKIAGCPKCGMVSTMGTDGYLRTQKTYSILSVYFQEPFLLGEELQYKDVHYTIFAIYSYAVKYEEWESEGSKWVQSTGFVTEWYAKSTTNLELTVMRDVDGQFYHVQRSADGQLSDWQIKEKVTEVGSFELSAFAGADDESLDIRGYYRCYPNNLLLESEKSDFAQKSFKTFFLTALSPSQVKRMEVIPDTEQMAAQEDFGDRTFYRNVFGFALLLILSLMVWENANTEVAGKSQRIIFEDLRDELGQPDTVALRPKSGGVFNLKKSRNYLFSAKSGVSGTNKDADFSVSIIRKEDATTVSEVDIAFYTESGRDSEGDWTENYLQDEFKFQVAQAGEYEVFVAPDYSDIANLPDCSLTVSVTPTGYNFYYLMASGALLLAFLIFQWQRENVVAYANLPHGTYLHDWTKQ